MTSTQQKEIAAIINRVLQNIPNKSELQTPILQLAYDYVCRYTSGELTTPLTDVQLARVVSLGKDDIPALKSYVAQRKKEQVVCDLTNPNTLSKEWDSLSSNLGPLFQSQKTTSTNMAKKTPAEQKPAVIGPASLNDLLGLTPSKPKNIPEKWKKHYAKLLELRDEMEEKLRDRASTFRNSDMGVSFAESGDIANQSLEQDSASMTLKLTQDELKDINDAIRRIENNNYGICEVTDQPIEAKRLLANPQTRYSVEGESMVRALKSKSSTSLRDILEDPEMHVDDEDEPKAKAPVDEDEDEDEDEEEEHEHADKDHDEDNDKKPKSYGLRPEEPDEDVDDSKESIERQLDV